VFGGPLKKLGGEKKGRFGNMGGGGRSPNWSERTIYSNSGIDPIWDPCRQGRRPKRWFKNKKGRTLTKIPSTRTRENAGGPKKQGPRRSKKKSSAEKKVGQKKKGGPKTRKKPSKGLISPLSNKVKG